MFGCLAFSSEFRTIWCRSHLFWQSCCVFSKVSVQTGAGQHGAAWGSTEQRWEVTAFSRSGSLCLVMPSAQPSGFSAGTFKAANILAIKLSLINAFKQRRRLVLRHFALRTHVEISALKQTNKQRRECEIFLAYGLCCENIFSVYLLPYLRVIFPGKHSHPFLHCLPKIVCH